ncbi:MAG: nitroreductase family protein [Tannerellaceae bacterium]|nr:nitroreductase family protein [Tannerellaceae bacterium]
MKRNFRDAVLNRRTIYGLSNQSPVSDEQIKEMLRFTLLHVPSAFNTQTTRLVLLLGGQHAAFWHIVKETLRKQVPEDAFPKTEAKINKSFASGYGTILFYEEQEIVMQMKKDYPLYKEKFPEWSEHTSAMHQFVLWTMLEDAGFGANLQHYNPIIDEKVYETWNIPGTWRLIAQMPFGVPTEGPGEKEYKPIEERLLIFE